MNAKTIDRMTVMDQDIHQHIHYKGKKHTFIIEKSGDHHFNKMIKIVQKPDNMSFLMWCIKYIIPPM